MPYEIKHDKVSGQYAVIRKSDGKVVAHSATLEKARGYIWHAEQGDRKDK